jgi:hypothetical protein
LIINLEFLNLENATDPFVVYKYELTGQESNERDNPVGSKDCIFLSLNDKYIIEKEIIPKLVLYCLYMKDNFLIKPISESYDLFLETFEKHKGKIFQSKIHTFNQINVFTSKDIVLALWIDKPAITIEDWENGEEDLCGSLRVLCMSPSSDEKYFKPEVKYFKPEVIPVPKKNNLGKKYKIDSERENYFSKKIRCAF